MPPIFTTDKTPLIDLPLGMPLNVPAAPLSINTNPASQAAAAAPGPAASMAKREVPPPPPIVIFARPQSPMPVILTGMDLPTIGSYLQAYETGLYRFVVRIWDLMRKRDSHLLTVSQKRFKRVSRLDWEIVPQDSSPEATAQAEFLADFYADIRCWKNAESKQPQGLAQALRHLMSAQANGHGACEILWRPRAGLDGSLRADLLKIRGDYFDEIGGVMKVYADVNDGSGMELPDAKFVVHQADTALMIASSLLFIIKWASVGRWTEFCRRYGLPGLIGTAPDSASPASKTAIDQMLMSWSEYMSAVLPPGYDIKTVASSLSGSLLPDQNLADWCDEALSVLWNGGDITSKSKSGTGTLAGTAQEDQQQELTIDDAHDLSGTLDYQLSAPAVMFQFGQPLLARLVFKLATEVDLASSIAVDMAIIQNTDIGFPEADFRAKYGIRTPEAGEAVVTAKAPAPAALNPLSPGLSGEPSGAGGIALKSAHAGVLAEAQRIAQDHADAARQAMAKILEPIRALVESSSDRLSSEELKGHLITLQRHLPGEDFEKVISGVINAGFRAGSRHVLQGGTR